MLTLNRLAVQNGASRTELELLAGLAYFELRQSPLATYTVDAGGARLTPIENLTVRVGLDNPPAVFAMLTGAANVERPGEFTAELHAGESLRGIPDDGKPYFRTNLILPEPWDSWNFVRDQAAADAADQRTAAREPYAGDQGYGWSDLDSHGTWYDVPGTGQVWQPENADEGFDPYGFGNWVFVNSNYVWASGYSWGWTPFHCGAWQYFGGFGWGWSPQQLLRPLGLRRQSRRSLPLRPPSRTLPPRHPAQARPRPSSTAHPRAQPRRPPATLSPRRRSSDRRPHPDSASRPDRGLGAQREPHRTSLTERLSRRRQNPPAHPRPKKLQPRRVFYLPDQQHARPDGSTQHSNAQHSSRHPRRGVTYPPQPRPSTRRSIYRHPLISTLPLRQCTSPPPAPAPPIARPK